MNFVTTEIPLQRVGRSGEQSPESGRGIMAPLIPGFHSMKVFDHVMRRNRRLIRRLLSPDAEMYPLPSVACRRPKGEGLPTSHTHCYRKAMGRIGDPTATCRQANPGGSSGCPAFRLKPVLLTAFSTPTTGGPRSSAATQVVGGRRAPGFAVRNE